MFDTVVIDHLELSILWSAHVCETENLHLAHLGRFRNRMNMYINRGDPKAIQYTIDMG